LLNEFTDYVISKLMNFLASRRGFTIREKTNIGQSFNSAVFSACEGDDQSSFAPGDLYRGQSIRRRAACRYRPENVAFFHKRFRLPGKYILITIVVGNRSYYRTVGRKGNSG
jgi:hypothetical protein